VTEVPFSFGVRAEGESKLTGKVMFRYLQQLGELYWSKYARLIVVALLGFLICFGLLLAQIVFNWEQIRDNINWENFGFARLLRN
jgi:hypothetical protein